MEHNAQLQSALKAVSRAKRIVVVCGAGVSVGAGIPDFRSSQGLFNSLKQGGSISSGKDLFEISILNSFDTAALFYKMIAQLASLSSKAIPTDFHGFLKYLDDKHKLLRVYTQNIDTLEQKAGLSFGVPLSLRSSGASSRQRIPQHSLPLTPRCVPLHGTLDNLICPRCSHTVPLTSFLSELSDGTAIPCPSCISINEKRALTGARERNVGILKPGVVLYGEEHENGEDVGECVRRDLIGLGYIPEEQPATHVRSSESAGLLIPTPGSSSPPSAIEEKKKTIRRRPRAEARPDLLIVAGTSLRIPGTKRIVHEFAKAVKSSLPPRTSTPPSPRKRKRKEKPAEGTSLPRTIYLNLDPPLPAREWRDVFDIWVQGDLQTFVRDLRTALEGEEVENIDVNLDSTRDEQPDVPNEGGVDEVPPAKRLTLRETIPPGCEETSRETLPSSRSYPLSNLSSNNGLGSTLHSLDPRIQRPSSRSPTPMTTSCPALVAEDERNAAVTLLSLKGNPPG